MNNYHTPALPIETISALNINPNGVYVDATFGGGGHSELIYRQLKEGFLFAFDQDKDALINNLNRNRFKLIQANYRHITQILKLQGVNEIDGLLADLGVSSYQFDQSKRGFSIRFDSKLDMRMNIDSNFTAIDVVNEYSEESLADIFYNYGDLNNSRKIANKIVNKRKKQKIITSMDLINTVSDLFPRKKSNQYLARIFQSIRIEVNDELEALKDMLSSSVDLLKKGGRIVVISYHSVEDKIVKKYFKTSSFSGEVTKDFFGNVHRKTKEINKKVIVATENQIAINPRVRSAKLRIAEKI
jgi:16S rRNA (cytosine1402-N4)-methyltransferase